MLMTKDQIAIQRSRMQAELKYLEEQEANYEKKAEGFTKLKELEAKYVEARIAMAKKFFITEDEMTVLNSPKSVFSIPYKDSLGVSKTYDWFPGKIGKAPTMVDLLKVDGLDGLMEFATDFGKEWMKTDAGKIALKVWMTPKTKKVKEVKETA